MTFDFDKINDRRNSNSEKWNVEDNELPMWVADMDFQTVPQVREAMQKDIDHGIFGYQYVPDKYYSAVADWYKIEHNFEPDTNWLTFATGVIPAVSSIIRHLTDVGDNILIQEPNYNSFFKTITSNGRFIQNSELIYENQQYSIDWDDLEDKLKDVNTTAMIVCNPHNPSGHIWRKDELVRIGQLAKKNHVLIISDEIHGDLTMPGHEYTPFASLDVEVSNNSISLVSPSKTFNLAILHAATLMIPDRNLKDRVERALDIDKINSPGILAVNGSIAAYTKGHEWLADLREYVFKNRKYATNFIAGNIDNVSVVKGDATYLIWIDCTKITDDSKELAQFIRQETGLYLSAGSMYKGNGNHFLRMNLATTFARVDDGLNRLKNGITKYVSEK